MTCSCIAYRFEIDYGRCNDDTRGLFRLTHQNLVKLTTCKGPTRQGGVYWTTRPWISEMADAGHVHLETCSPTIDVSRRTGGR